MIKKKAIGRFSYIVIIIAVIFAIIILTLFSLLWSALEKFESNTPESYMKDMLSYIKNGEITSFMNKVNIESSEFFTPDDYKNYLEDNIGEDIDNAIIEEYNSENEIVDGKQEQSYTFLVHTKDKDGILFTLTSNGKSNSDELLFLCRQEDIVFSNMLIHAPSQAKVVAGGVKLSDKYAVNRKVIKGFETVSDRKDLPQKITYKIERFIVSPEISVAADDNNKYLLSDSKQSNVLDKSPDINIVLDIEDSLKKSIEKFSVASAKTYAMFISKDIERSEFIKLVAKDSDFYNSVMNFDNTWFSVHSSYAFENIATSNIMAYSDKYFSCDVSFNYIIKQNRTAKTYNMNYRLMLERVHATTDSAEGYKIVNLINI